MNFANMLLSGRRRSPKNGVLSAYSLIVLLFPVLTHGAAIGSNLTDAGNNTNRELQAQNLKNEDFNGVTEEIMNSPDGSTQEGSKIEPEGTGKTMKELKHETRGTGDFNGIEVENKIEPVNGKIPEESKLKTEGIDESSGSQLKDTITSTNKNISRELKPGTIETDDCFDDKFESEVTPNEKNVPEKVNLETREINNQTNDAATSIADHISENARAATGTNDRFDDQSQDEITPNDEQPPQKKSEKPGEIEPETEEMITPIDENIPKELKQKTRENDGSSEAQIKGTVDPIDENIAAKRKLETRSLGRPRSLGGKGKSPSPPSKSRIFTANKNMASSAPAVTVTVPRLGLKPKAPSPKAPARPLQSKPSIQRLGHVMASRA